MTPRYVNNGCPPPSIFKINHKIKLWQSPSTATTANLPIYFAKLADIRAPQSPPASPDGSTSPGGPTQQTIQDQDEVPHLHRTHLASPRRSH
ncbi:hypothetical protein AVEN_134357-1, partial [Araneus ventricosus]